MRIAVVFPFLDKRHGTERCIVEQIERFLKEPSCEIHIYAQSVQDPELVPWQDHVTSDSEKGKAFFAFPPFRVRIC